MSENQVSQGDNGVDVDNIPDTE
eukprot:SAG11_NODE_40744_length_199_cov_106.000000_1_plen_22_part_10